MATLSNIGVQDEFQHPVGPEEQWNESYYFNLYDPDARIGGFARIGIRPNEGTIDGALLLFLPDGSLAVTRQLGEQTENTDEIEVGGIRFERVDPLKAWRVTWAGTAAVMPRPEEMVNPGGPSGIEFREIAVDLAFTCLSEPVSGREAEEVSEATKELGVDLVLGHFEQAGRWSGSITIQGTEHAFSGYGNRDKSWGVRDWQGPSHWRWFSANFGDDLALGAVRIGFGEKEIQSGWLWREGAPALRFTGVEVKTELADDGITQVRSILDLCDENGETHHLEGELLSVAPLPQAKDGRRTLINEGLARWTYDDRVGYGISEYLHQLDDAGAPVAAIQ